MQRLGIAVLLLGGALLLAACGGDDDPSDPSRTATATPEALATPPATPAPKGTPAATPALTGTPAASPSPTAAPVQRPPGEVLLCDPEGDRSYLYVPSGRCTPPSSNGFVTTVTPEVLAALERDPEVPACFAWVGDDFRALRITVGRLCEQQAALTTEPRPPELVGVIADGDLVAACRLGDGADDPFEVGPPCVMALGAGFGPYLLTDPAPLEGIAVCNAGNRYFGAMETRFRAIAEPLATVERLVAQREAATALAADADWRGAMTEALAALTAARAGIPHPLGERARVYFDGTADESHPARLGEKAADDLDALLPDIEAAAAGQGAPPPSAALAELSAELQRSIDWFGGGRGC